MINISGVRKLEKNELKNINAGGIQACVRRHQRMIIKAQNLDRVNEETRVDIINGFVEDAKKCYTHTNVL